jgi:RNA polymerase sporulation-specific sigma factor
MPPRKTENFVKTGGFAMFGAVISLMLNGYALCLRLTGKGGSFQRPLTPGEEEEALAAMAAGDKDAREMLIIRNMRLIPHIIKKYYVDPDDQDDLISIGTIGLVKAIDSFSPDKKTKLATYACTCIQNEIFMYFRGLKKRTGEVFLFDRLEQEPDGSPLAVMDVLQTDDGVLERLEREDECRKVRDLVKECLDPRQREIIILRYGLGGMLPLAQREVAGRLGISRSYVSRIEKKALKALGDRMPVP